MDGLGSFITSSRYRGVGSRIFIGDGVGEGDGDGEVGGVESETSIAVSD